jgi:hypothetical protein
MKDDKDESEAKLCFHCSDEFVADAMKEMYKCLVALQKESWRKKITLRVFWQNSDRPKVRIDNVDCLNII